MGVAKKIGRGIGGWYSKRKAEGRIRKARSLEHEAERMSSEMRQKYSRVLTVSEFGEVRKMNDDIAGRYIRAAKLYSLCGMLVSEAECLRSVANLGIDVEGNLLTAIECERKEAVGLAKSIMASRHGKTGVDADSLLHRLKLCYLFMEKEYLHIIRHYALSGPEQISQERKDEYHALSRECRNEAERIGLFRHMEGAEKIVERLPEAVAWLERRAPREMEYKP